MHIFEIVIPGTWLDYEDRDWTFKTEGQLGFLQSHFYTANAALNLFVDAQSIKPSCTNRDSWMRDSQRRSEIQSEIERERGRDGSREAFEEIRIETDRRFKREKWASGTKPREFEHGLPFIYARAFLYALDAFDKFLGILAKKENVPAQVSKLQAQFLDAFPNLRQVRNTTQHLEDRSRGLGVGKNELELKPITNGAIHAPNGGVLVLESLNGSRYGSTMADGHFGEIDVSPESMQQLSEVFDGVLNSFKWTGPKQHLPSA